MTGLVLCGGESQRMGQDKGLLVNESKRWVTLAANLLAVLEIPVYISVSQTQAPIYKNLFSDHQLITDLEMGNLKGPLLGVLSAFRRFPAEDIFVLACDMQKMQVSTVQQLFQIYMEESGYDAYVFTLDGEPEPLCAIYRTDLLFRIDEMYRKGLLHRNSMKYLISQSKSCCIPLADHQRDQFKNFNQATDLQSL